MEGLNDLRYQNGQRVESGLLYDQGQVLADNDGRLETRPELTKSALERLQNEAAETKKQTELSASWMKRVKVTLREVLPSVHARALKSYTAGGVKSEAGPGPGPGPLDTQGAA